METPTNGSASEGRRGGKFEQLTRLRILIAVVAFCAFGGAYVYIIFPSGASDPGSLGMPTVGSNAKPEVNGPVAAASEHDNDVLRKRISEAQAQHEFSESLSRYRSLKAELLEKEHRIAEDHPLVAVSFDFSVNFRSQAHARNKKGSEKWNALPQEQKDLFGKLNPQNLVMGSPQFYLTALSSTEQVGNSTLGAITWELISQTKGFDIAKVVSESAVRRYLGDEAVAAAINRVEKPEELVEMLQRVAPRLQPKIDQNLSAMSANDADIRRYLDETSYGNGVFGLMQRYREHWTAEMDSIRRQLLVLREQLDRSIQALPAYSKERVQLEEQWAEALASFESSRSSDRKTPTE